MIQRILNQLEDFFGISRKQARGAALLIFFSFLIIWFPFLYRRLILPLFPVEKETFDSQKLDSIAKSISEQPAISANRYENHGFLRTETGTPAKVRLADFDPNTADISQLTELGIPPFLAKRIDKYRSKGGKFRKKEDLLHIYDFPADLYQKLEPYIHLRVEHTKDNGRMEENRESIPSQKVVPAKTDRPPYIKPNIATFDINVADTTDLIKLRGIGSKLAQRIIKFRDGLGGFHATDQFAEIFGLDSLALSQLNQYARISSPVQKININEVSPEQLAAHSYLRNRKLATVIVNYKTQHGPYRSAEDLKKIRIMDEKTLEKITPYLSF